MMPKYSKFLLLLLSISFVSGSPFIKDEKFEPNLDENKDAKSQEPKIKRLTGDVTPRSYEIRINADLQSFTYSGIVKIVVSVKSGAKKIELHSKKLAINQVGISKATSQRPIDSTFKIDEINEIIEIEVVQELITGMEYLLTIEFSGVLNDEMEGFYRSSYTIHGKEIWLAATKFEPTHARKAFPCFDEPRFRTPFTIYIARSEDQKAISNMPIENPSIKDPDLKDRVWTQFKESPPMSTYLVAFILSHSSFNFVTDDEKKVNVWARENAITDTTYALKQSVKLLKQLESYTGILFPLPKLDVVALPDFKSGAMENWGMTTYRENYVLTNELTSAEFHKFIVSSFISHEFSHQWFGDLVTPEWWDYLWLNEGFASYFEYFATAEVEPSWDLDKFFVVETVQGALWDEIKVQRAMTTSITTNSEIKGAFDVISYDKAASIIRMLEHIVGSPNFKASIQNYLKNWGTTDKGTVTQTNFLEECDEQTYDKSLPLPPNKQISEIMKPWTENIGYPLIKMTRDKDTHKIKIEQTTYKSPRADKPAPDQEWIVPLTYTTKSERKFSDTRPTLWSFANKAIDLPKEVAPTDWVILNLQQSGYYRVNYDYKSWHLIIDQLNQDHNVIHVLNRAQLIDDSFTLARDNLLCFHRPFYVAQYLPKETEWMPWYSAITQLNGLLTEYQGTSIEEGIRTYIKLLFKIPYENFGFDIKPTDNHVTKRVKPLFLNLACKAGHEGCSKQVLEEYNKNKNDLSQVQPDLKKLVFCNALRYSENQQDVFNNLWSTYLKSNFAYEKSVILVSISCATDGEIIKKIFSKMTDSKNKEIRKQDHPFVLRTVFLNIPSTTATINFLLDTVPTISQLDENGITLIKSILETLEKKVTTEQQIKLLKELEPKLKALDQQKYDELIKLTKKAYEKGTKTIEENKKKAENLTPILGEFLPQPKAPSTESPKPSSAPSALVSSLWSRSLIIGIALYYSLPAFRIL